MANFESFHRRMLALKDEPHLTIHRRGTISINRSGYEALGAPDAVELLFDRGKQIVGLRAIAEDAENAYQLRRPASSTRGPWVVSAMAFTRFYDIDTSESVRRTAYLDDDVLCTDLSLPGETVGARPRSTT